MPFPAKASTEQIVAAYRETGSVWKVGLRLGMAGQSVHERLRAIGYPMASRVWTDEETAEMGRLIAAKVSLAEIARRLGRTYAAVACRASELGQRSTPVRARKIKAKPFFDAASVEQHIAAIESSSLKPTQYARANGIDIELLVQAIQRFYPDRWNKYLAAHSNHPPKTCGYCPASFIPANGKQRYCTRACAEAARADRSYFGGNRRATVGLADGVCQLCGKHGAKGLSSHHVLGKENDPEHLDLVALCPGCHHIVGCLGGSTFVDDPKAWEKLIAFAWLRRHGGDRRGKPGTIYTEVIIEEWDEEIPNEEAN